MDMYRKVRLASAEGMSQREAARHFNISRDSVRKMMAFSVPPGYRRQAAVTRPKLDAFTGIIDAWLDGDRDVHRKQRHTAKRVYERLRDEHGFTGGYTIIKDYMRKRELRGREMFVPLAHPPGHAQADFGEAIVIIGGVATASRRGADRCRAPQPRCSPIGAAASEVMVGCVNGRPVDSPLREQPSGTVTLRH